MTRYSHNRPLQMAQNASNVVWSHTTISGGNTGERTVSSGHFLPRILRPGQ